jgi:hypothetical protein
MRLLEITTKIGCSNYCKYCPQELLIKTYTKKSKKIFLSFEDFSNILDKIPKDVTISFCGFCEPFLNPQCSEMIQLASSKGYNILIYTTLVGMNLKDVEILKKISPEIFCIHLPGNNGRENILVNEDYLKVMTALLKSKIYLTFDSFGDLNPQVKDLLDSFDIPPEVYMSDKREVNNRAGNLKFSKTLNKGRGPLTCLNNRLEGNVLLPNGDVVLCCMDYNLSTKLGNLLEQDYEDLFKSKEFLSLKHKLSIGGEGTLCKSCEWGVYSDLANSPRFKLKKNMFELKRKIRYVLIKTGFGRKILKISKKL